jgi:hypothetical protein
MGNVTQENVASKYLPVALPFQATDVPDAAGNMTTVQVGSNDYVAPYAGSIIAISVRHNADLTGGTITWRPTIGGTADTVMTVVTDDTNQQAYASVDARRIPFAAGARLGIDWTKTGTVAPTTTDVAGLLLVLFEDVEL